MGVGAALYMYDVDVKKVDTRYVIHGYYMII